MDISKDENINEITLLLNQNVQNDNIFDYMKILINSG